MSSFQSPDSSLFFSRHESEDPRLGELHGSGKDVAILGYPDDEGIRLNGGREGAKLGPTEIRRLLYRMTPHLQRPLRDFKDFGDLQVSGDLATRHTAVTKKALALLGEGKSVLSFGGGNDYAYADGFAFLQKYASENPLVINVDAHFDVRPLKRGLNSGTPFFRLLESPYKFDFVEFGIQSQCNARAHRDYVLAKGGKILTVEDHLASGLSLLEFTMKSLGETFLRRRPCFLAIDIDAFSLPYAPGASSSWPLGLQPADFFSLYMTWLRRLDVRVLGIYEVSPPLDVAQAAVKWAAQLAHGFLHDV